MNKSNAIEINTVSKRYTIGSKQSYETLADQVNKLIKWLTRKNQNKELKSDFWALNKVSLNIKSGDVVGIIGRNGAGKSTLLKIISRITEPTSGTITLRGRVASLLEVGTGFSPELTGRENIFLNGSILGMRKKEISSKFDEIVAFSGVEKFIDTPVKHYSSGMYVRLAFAVAAHLESEILLVDEVLAVGDAEFQQKCLNKISSLTQEKKRTVFFVSHSLQTVQKLCDVCVLMDQGEVVLIGKPQEVISQYLHSDEFFQSVSTFPPRPSRPATITRIEILDHEAKPNYQLAVGKMGSLVVEVMVHQPIDKATLTVAIENQDGIILMSSFDDLSGSISAYKPGIHCFTVSLPPYLLNSGSYLLDFGFCYPGVTYYDRREQILIDVIQDDNAKQRVLGTAAPGVTLLPLHFDLQMKDSLI